MKFQCMAEHQWDYPVTTMCCALEVSVSGYYAWRKREPSQHCREDAELADKICVAFQSNRCVYRGACGSPRIHAQLHATSASLRSKTGRSSHARTGAGGKTSAPSNRYHEK
jgi:hypothetical protein